MQPGQINIKDFTYTLPEECIAKHPLPERQQSKLLVYRNGTISENSFSGVTDFFNPGDCLVFNNTRVIHARILFEKESGARIEIMCLEPLVPAEPQLALQQKGSCEWWVMIGNNKRWKDGLLEKKITVNNAIITLKAERTLQAQDTFCVRFSWEGNCSFSELIEQGGLLPLPPYLNRDAEADDEIRYQTVYARQEGSVAAPTAGLHFTPQLLHELSERDVRTEFLTLHVGAGTFKPVKSETLAGHEMHEERMYVTLNLLQTILATMQQGNNVIAVGTTSLRTLESLYWFGMKLFYNRDRWTDIKELALNQWDPYEWHYAPISATEAVTVILEWMGRDKREVLSGTTKLLLAPPYSVRMADILITNFHQPESTLLLLVAAFIGNDWKEVYEYALKNRFRFLSYGDSSILCRKP